jgi:hypothetical protein
MMMMMMMMSVDLLFASGETDEGEGSVFTRNGL